MHDIIRQTDEELEALRAAFQLVQDAVYIVDARLGRIVDANAAACGLLGVERDELLGRAWGDVLPRVGPVTQCGSGPGLFAGVVRLYARCDAKEADITRDALTGLANRQTLFTRATCDNARNPPARLALMFIDLDGFKRINDSWGHVAGDHVLRIVAQRLADSVRPGDLIVRYGGDEFVMLVEGVTRRRDLERLARRIGRAVRRPILVAGHEIELSASIGIADRKTHGPTIDALIVEADRDMYAAKFRRRDSQSELPRPFATAARATDLLGWHS